MLKTPCKKENKYIALPKNNLKLSISDVKIKSIKRLINGKGYYVTLYISEETNNDVINNLIEFDDNIINEIVNNSSSWFNRNFVKEDVDKLYTRSFCKQTKTINVIISSNNFNNITYNNETITDVDNIISILKENNKYKKCIINLSIEYNGLYIYKESTSNKWIIKDLDINDITNENIDWFSADDIIENLENRIDRVNKSQMNKISKYKRFIEDYETDYNNILLELEKIKKSSSRDLNSFLDNIDKLLIIQEEKINNKI